MSDHPFFTNHDEGKGRWIHTLSLTETKCLARCATLLPLFLPFNNPRDGLAFSSWTHIHLGASRFIWHAFDMVISCVYNIFPFVWFWRCLATRGTDSNDRKFCSFKVFCCLNKDYGHYEKKLIKLIIVQAFVPHL